MSRAREQVWQQEWSGSFYTDTVLRKGIFCITHLSMECGQVRGEARSSNKVNWKSDFRQIQRRNLGILVES
jgi:hypothetical protein